MVRLQKFQIQQKQNSNKSAKHEKEGEGIQHREEETKTQNQNHKVTKEQFELVWWPLNVCLRTFNSTRCMVLITHHNIHVLTSSASSSSGCSRVFSQLSNI